MRITTHLILVSAQPIPNLSPLLDTRLKPDKVIMLVSPGMEERSHALASILKPRGIQIERCPIDDPWDTGEITDKLITLLDSYPEGSIALNATGGTKLMSIAAFDVFRSCNQPIYYIQPGRDRLLWLYPQQAPLDLADTIKLEDYLKAYGVSTVTIPCKLGVPEHERNLGETIVVNMERYLRDVGALNNLAYQALGHPQLETEITDGPLTRPNLWELLDLFTEAGLCQINGHKLRFTDEKARFMANGGWLERYVYGLALNLKKPAKLQDIAANITIHRERQGVAKVSNELDLAIMKDNRLFLVECKTKQYRQTTGKEADALYKLDSLRDLIGGLQGQAMLISFNKLDNAGQARAKELNIHYCCGSGLKNLQNELHDWLLTTG